MCQIVPGDPRACPLPLLASAQLHESSLMPRSEPRRVQLCAVGPVVPWGHLLQTWVIPTTQATKSPKRWAPNPLLLGTRDE